MSKPKAWSTWWRVMVATFHYDGSVTAFPVPGTDKHPFRVTAHEEMIRLHREQPLDEGQYVIIETDAEPGWNWGAYGKPPDSLRKASTELENQMRSHGVR